MSGKVINAKVRLCGRIDQARINVKQAGRDPFAAIKDRHVLGCLCRERHQGAAARATGRFRFSTPHRRERRYAPEFLDVLKLWAAPAAKDVLDVIQVLRGMNSDNARKMPADASTGAGRSW
ncbi:hypothetical protein P910_002497 [Xylella fastidiosa Mul-MD]|nr:hypothetical protein P910_002497 [Xylella fastidiosa Mul-MD]